MAAAPRMMVRHALTLAGRRLIAIAIKMTGCLDADRNTVKPLRRMRRSACPQHQDEHHCANEGNPAVHQSPSEQRDEVKGMPGIKAIDEPSACNHDRLGQTGARDRLLRAG